MAAAGPGLGLGGGWLGADGALSFSLSGWGPRVGGGLPWAQREASWQRWERWVLLPLSRVATLRVGPGDPPESRLASRPQRKWPHLAGSCMAFFSAVGMSSPGLADLPPVPS